MNDKERAQEFFARHHWRRADDLADEFASIRAPLEQRIAALESVLGQVREWWLSAVNSEGRGSFDFHIEFHREFPLGDVNAALSGAGEEEKP